LSLFETLPSCELLASKGIKCFFITQRFLTPSGVHLRRSCSHLARSSFSFLWHVCIHRKTIFAKLPRQKCLCSTLLLFRYPGRSSRGHKKPRRP